MVTTILSLPFVVMLVAMDFAAGVIKLAVELGALTRRNGAVGFGLGLVPLDLRLIFFDLRGLAGCERSVFQSVGDAILLILLAAVDAGRVVAVATDFAARLVKFAVELLALIRRDDAVRLGLGLVLPNLRFIAFDLRGLAARQGPVLQSVGDAVLLILLAAVNARRIVAVPTDFAARLVKFAVELLALIWRDDAVRLGFGLVLPNLRFIAFDLRGLAARQ